MQMYQELFRKVFRYNATTSQGTLTITSIPLNGEIITIGNKTYTWQTVLTNVDGNIAIGGSLAAAQQNLIDAINLTSTTGGPGNQYAGATTEHSQVSAATAWVANTLVITAKTAGVAGNSIATTETMVSGSFDAATLGTTRAGADESDSDTLLWSANINNATFLQALLILSMPHGQTSMTTTSKVRQDGKTMTLDGHQNFLQPVDQEKW
jgi:hypothetical protein